MRYVYPLAFHTAREGGETDSTRQTCVPQPSASVPTRYHVVCYASQAGVECGEHAYCDGSFARRRPGLPARRQGGSAAFHVALGAEGSGRAVPTPVLNRDSWLPS